MNLTVDQRANVQACLHAVDAQIGLLEQAVRETPRGPRYWELVDQLTGKRSYRSFLSYLLARRCERCHHVIWTEGPCPRCF